MRWCCDRGARGLLVWSCLNQVSGQGTACVSCLRGGSQGEHQGSMLKVWSLLEELLMPWADTQVRHSLRGSEERQRKRACRYSEERMAEPLWYSSSLQPLIPRQELGQGWKAGCVASYTPLVVNSLPHMRHPAPGSSWARDSQVYFSGCLSASERGWCCRYRGSWILTLRTYPVQGSESHPWSSELLVCLLESFKELFFFI